MISDAQHTALSAEQVNKKFYTRFKRVYASFLTGIQGLPDQAERQTYALLVLNRLLVLSFLQQHGLLDDTTDYLSAHLHAVQRSQGQDRFYRHYLLPLFFERSGTSRWLVEHDVRFGRIPALDLDLFQPHAVERANPSIDIPDAAIAQVLSFFAAYQWRLDPHTPREENSLHPDILAYIFERHIDQKEMGAYYTQEDVTIYIASNTIIPCLLHTLQKICPTLHIWLPLQRDPDRYIHASLRTAEYLSQETTLEYRSRRLRYQELYTLLQDGRIKNLDDCTTYNLDHIILAQDLILACQEPAHLLACYACLEQMKILDPTCGSGAFLFAALTLLQKLYTACLERLHTLATHEQSVTTQCSTESRNMATYRDILERASHHPNQHHFILSHIIQHNLFGVDLMPEAIAMCKLRLYLALLAHTTRSEDVQPASALSWNIHAGNALVGHVSDTADQAGHGEMPEVHHQPAIPDPEHELQSFHWHTAFPAVMKRGGFDVIIGNPPYIEYSKVRERYLANGYEEKSCGNLYAAVIERSLALCRSGQSYLGLIVPLSICGSRRFEGVRHTLKLGTAALWLANFEIFPGRLFASAFQRLSILLARHTEKASASLYTTRIHRWYASERPHLIELVHYTPVEGANALHIFPRLASPLQASLLCKVLQKSAGRTIGSVLHTQRSAHFVYYQEATNYWTKAVCHVPFYKKNGIVKAPAHGRFLFFRDEITARTIMALMNSSLFYTWFAIYSDGFHLAHTLATTFPVSDELYSQPELPALSLRLEEDIARHARQSTRNSKPGARQWQQRIELEEYHMGRSKALLDEIDGVLARHYNFTTTELAFILNYDIKYRMGRDLYA